MTSNNFPSYWIWGMKYLVSELLNGIHLVLLLFSFMCRSDLYIFISCIWRWRMLFLGDRVRLNRSWKFRGKSSIKDFLCILDCWWQRGAGSSTCLLDGSSNCLFGWGKVACLPDGWMLRSSMWCLSDYLILADTVFNWEILLAPNRRDFGNTRKYGHLRGPAFSSCGGI